MVNEIEPAIVSIVFVANDGGWTMVMVFHELVATFQ